MKLQKLTSHHLDPSITVVFLQFEIVCRRQQKEISEIHKGSRGEWTIVEKKHNWCDVFHCSIGRTHLEEPTRHGAGDTEVNLEVISTWGAAC